MDIEIREAQRRVLDVFSKYNEDFSLTGGTALELYYLNHRFSKDLDFFSNRYNKEEIDRLIAQFREKTGMKFKLTGSFKIRSRAEVRFYSTKLKGSKKILKLDFVEEMLIDKPKIKYFGKIPVYDVMDIYFQKISTVTGTGQGITITGAQNISGRGEIRDIIDLYYLSKKIKPLRDYLKDISREYQHSMIQWFRTYPRMEFKLGFLDYEIYDKKLDSRGIINHIDSEIRIFMEGEIQ